MVYTAAESLFVSLWGATLLLGPNMESTLAERRPPASRCIWTSADGSLPSMYITSHFTGCRVHSLEGTHPS
ncbi:hypothetical protein F5141DRAFT_1081336 [Pisolithus sp. B1]|nr:hypothetical protein F5141DRAFT_1081336 [Pisolithus sp. B1]